MVYLHWLELAVACGALTWAGMRLPDRIAGLMLAAVVAAGAAIWLMVSENAAIALVIAASGTLAASRFAARRRRSRRRTAGAVALGLAPGLLCFACLGATLPAATWFGATVAHGSRDGNEVAITFDDGPNGQWTLDVMRALDEAGVKATFFEVGKAVEAQPQVTQALLADGQLIANHSYSHGRWDFLMPGYPDLGKAESAIHSVAGVCPAFYRPPHGDRTPLTVNSAGGNGLTTVTWDDEAGDWATDDPDVVATRILDNVRPGSIILLHDGIDGNPGVDRSVVAEALPEILAGLKARGLQPVRLDELLGLPAYNNSC